MSTSVRTRARPGASLRLRVVLITATAVTAMVAIGGFLTVSSVRGEFVEAARSVSRERASEVAELARAGVLPSRLPNIGDEEILVQVVRQGRVVSRTGNVPRTPGLPLPAQEPGSMELLVVDDLPVGTGPYQVTALGTSTPQGPATIHVAVSTEDVHDVTSAALKAGALELVLLVVPLSVLLWFAVGRTLAPVEAIRERAEAITGDHLSDRVPEPSRLDEVGRLARTINDMLGRLDVSASQQRRFVADAAHELRSPIASLRAQLEATGDTAGAEKENLRADVLRMQSLVDQLLLLAQSDAGAIPRRHVPVDLDDTVVIVVGALEPERPRPDVRIDISDVAPVKVTGDPGLLEQLVRNLLENAVRYADREVRVSLHREGDRAVLMVDDDGPGIPEASRAEVFARFARLDGSRARREGGVGLGLAIVADIVRSHDGSVSVLDSPSGGARLRVNLPAVEE